MGDGYTLVQEIANHFGLSENEVYNFLMLHEDRKFDREFAAGGKIQAIKQFKRATGFSLLASKLAVEAIQKTVNDKEHQKDVRGFEQRILTLEELVNTTLQERDNLRAALNSALQLLNENQLRELVHNLI